MYIRKIAYHNRGEPIYGITIPKEVQIFHPETSFKVERTGNDILLKSGTNHILTKKEIINYDFSGCRI